MRLLLLTDILSRTVSKLLHITVQIFDEKRPFCVFESPLEVLGGTHAVRLRLLGNLKARSRSPIRVN